MVRVFTIICCVVFSLWCVGQMACQTQISTEPQAERALTDGGTEPTTPKDASVEAAPEPAVQEQMPEPEPEPLKWAMDTLTKALPAGVSHELALPALTGGVGAPALTLKQAPQGVVLQDGKLQVAFSYDQKDAISFEVIAKAGEEEAALKVSLTPTMPKWTTLPTDNGPSMRANPAMALAGKRLLVLGGFLQGTSGSNDLWSFDRESKTWKEITNKGDQPPAAGVFRWVVTSVKEEGQKIEGLVVQAMLGNNEGHNVSYKFAIDDHEATWTKLKVDGTLPTGFEGLAIGVVGYDPKLETVFLFGGINPVQSTASSRLFLGKVTGDSIKWEDKTPQTFPPARYGAQFGMDPVNGRLFVASGTGVGGALTDVWVLHTRDEKGPRWEELKPEGTFTGRQNGALLVDVIHNRIFIWGGSAGGFAPTDVSTLSLDEKPLKWHALPTPPLVPLRTSIYGASDPLTGESFIGFGRSSNFVKDLYSFHPNPPQSK